MANRYIVDSGGVYTLYVDQGTEFSFSVPFSKFGIIGTVVPRTISVNPDNDVLATGSNLDTLVVIIEPQLLTSNGALLDVGFGNFLSANGILDFEMDWHVANVTFAGVGRRDNQSKKYVEFTTEKDLVNGNLILSLSAQATFELTYPRYGFDVYYKNTITGNTVKAFGGSIIVSHTLTLNI